MIAQNPADTIDSSLRLSEDFTKNSIKASIRRSAVYSEYAIYSHSIKSMNRISFPHNGVRYSREGHTVVHDDCVNALEQIDNSSVDLIFADPPYNIGKKFGDFTDRWETDEAYVKWCINWLNLCIDKLHPHGSLYVMSSTQAMPYIDLFLRKKMTILSRIVWHYDSSGVQAKRHFGSLYEPILFAVKDAKNYTFNANAIAVDAKTGSDRKLIDYRRAEPAPYSTKKTPGNAWYIPRVRYRMEEYEEHPTQKPEALLERIIRASSNAGDLVLDPFAGTFTTCAVAKRLERRSIGIESQLDFIKIGLRRLQIADSFNGEPLKRSKKTYMRKNKKPLVSPPLFDESEQ